MSTKRDPHGPPLHRILLVALVAIFSGCSEPSATTLSPPGSAAPPVRTDLTAAIDLALTTPPPAQPGGPEGIELPGTRSLGVVVPGQPSSDAHPHGTGIATYSSDDVPSGLIEIDLDSVKELRRRPIEVAGTLLHVRRDGASIHVAVHDEPTGTLVWLTYDLDLVETHRVKLPVTWKDGDFLVRDFAVLDGQGIVAARNERTGYVEGWVFDPRGHLAGHPMCAPLGATGFAVGIAIAYAKPLVVIKGLTEPYAEKTGGLKGQAAICTFPLARPSAVRGAMVDGAFVESGVLYGLDERRAPHKVGNDLRLEASVVADPRRPPVAACPMTGAFVVEDRWIEGVEVRLTAGCCDGPKGGLFFCR